MNEEGARQILDAVRRLDEKLDVITGHVGLLTTRIAVIEAGNLELRLRDLEARHATVRAQLVIAATGMSILVTVALRLFHVT